MPRGHSTARMRGLKSERAREVVELTLLLPV